jgi:hypothetical protein
MHRILAAFFAALALLRPVLEVLRPDDHHAPHEPAAWQAPIPTPGHMIVHATARSAAMSSGRAVGTLQEQPWHPGPFARSGAT